MGKSLIRGAGRYKKQKLVELAGNKVLLVGCGNGKYLNFCISTGRETFGVDISHDRLLEAGAAGRVALADALALPFPEDCFDTVVMWDVMEHLADDCSGLKESIRVSTRNVLISVPSEDVLPDYSSGVTFRTYTDQSHMRYYNRPRLQSLLSVCGQKNYTIEMFDRVRPALMYRRIGIPRHLLSILDKMMWLASSRSDKFMRNYFVEVRLSGSKDSSI